MAFSPDKLPTAGTAARFLGKRQLSKGSHSDSSQLAKLVKELKTNSSLRFLGLGSPAHISGTIVIGRNVMWYEDTIEDSRLFMSISKSRTQT